MFSRIMTGSCTKIYSKAEEQLKAAIDNADAILIGAGAGLSTAAGYTYNGDRFKAHFSDFEKKYGFHDMYSGGFYPYKTLEEYWAYWSRYIYINRYMDIPKNTYSTLYELVRDKDHFVITTNVDHCFQRAGFDKKRLFYTQGDYGLFQCSTPCRNVTFDNEEAIRKMVSEQSDMRIPTELVPYCPHCGRPLTMNLRADDTFAEDDGWHNAAERYSLFLQRHKNMKIVFLELGVGSNTPVIIKYPFWRMTAEDPDAIYACVNYGEAYAPPEIKARSICINDDIDRMLTSLAAK